MKFTALLKTLPIFVLALWITAVTGPQLSLAEVSGGSDCKKCQLSDPVDCTSSIADCTGTFRKCEFLYETGTDVCNVLGQICTTPDLSCQESNVDC